MRQRDEAKPGRSHRPTPVTPPADELASRHWKPFGLGALLLLLTLTAYLPALRAGFIWDDDDYITQNLTLRTLAGLGRIWFQLGAVPQYYPLVHTSFWLEYHLWGLNPLGYHLVNVLLHGLAAVLLWRVLCRLEVNGAWLAAVVFALHPVCVESVAWVTELKNVLSVVFYFASALVYLRFALPSSPPSQPPPVTRHPSLLLFVSLVLFVCALLSKTVACSLPAALLLVLWWKQGRCRGRDVLSLLPFFAVGLGLGLLTAWLEKHQVGAHGSDWALTPAQRCLIAGRALWFYAEKLLWPANLTFIYPRWTVAPGLWLQWLYPAAIAAVVTALWLARGKLGRGPLVAVLFFAGTLLPALGFINTYPMRYSFVADHFQYLASIGLIAFAAAGLGRLPKRFHVLLAAIPLALGILTWQQTHIYHDLDTLWRDTLAKNPSCWMAHNNLGEWFKTRGRIPEAEAQYLESLRLKEDNTEAWNNLGVVRGLQGRDEEALDCYRQSLRFGPDFPPALNNLGGALLARGKLDEAGELFARALRVQPNNADTYNNSGTLLAAKKQRSDAITAFKTALQLDPDHVEAHINLANTLLETGDTAEAVNHLQAALRLDPNQAKAQSDLAKVFAGQGRFGDAIEHYQAAANVAPTNAQAHYELGVVFSAAEQAEKAMEQYRLALKYDPTYPEAHNNLGVALMLSGRRADAIEHFAEAVRLKPAYAEAQNNLGYALADEGKTAEAASHFQEALRLNPDYPQAHFNLGKALAKLGRRADGVAHLEKALRLNPNYAEARSSLRALQGETGR